MPRDEKCQRNIFMYSSLKGEPNISIFLYIYIFTTLEACVSEKKYLIELY